MGLLQLLPFSLSELRDAVRPLATLDEYLVQGFYPPLYDRLVSSSDWFAAYIATYVERDLRQLINVRDLSAFQRFVKMCAARTGQLLNLSALAADCGISHNTAAAWISVLEASYIIHLLRPHYRNFNKRIVKTPKLYFCDVGLAAWLLGVREPEQARFHAQRGALFETLVVNEFLKQRLNDGQPTNLFFWRDSKGLEIDLLLENGDDLTPVEIKSGQTIVPDFFTGLKQWLALSGTPVHPAWLIYGGEREHRRDSVAIIPWNFLPAQLPMIPSRELRELA